jgi:hypothetical protein
MKTMQFFFKYKKGVGNLYLSKGTGINKSMSNFRETIPLIQTWMYSHYRIIKSSLKITGPFLWKNHETEKKFTEILCEAFLIF